MATARSSGRRSPPGWRWPPQSSTAGASSRAADGHGAGAARRSTPVSTVKRPPGAPCQSPVTPSRAASSPTLASATTCPAVAARSASAARVTGSPAITSLTWMDGSPTSIRRTVPVARPHVKAGAASTASGTHS